MKHNLKDQNLVCSFCSLSELDVDFLVEGEGVYICDKCVLKASEIVKENFKKTNFSKSITNKKPKTIKNSLDKHIMSQETAKRIVSVAVYNHLKRINTIYDDDDVEIEKSNILLIGPTGTGKTLIAKTLANILNVPFAIADATVLTEAGYVGEDVENILVRLYQSADYDVKKAEMGIIYVDEIDKISRKDGNPSITRDVSGEGVQQALLKMFEGTIANIPPKGGRKHPEQPLISINTKNILFICGGAFQGLEEIVEKRIVGGGMGFNRDVKDKTNHDFYKHVQPEDLLKYGFIPELIGRLPVIAPLESLNKETMLTILTEPQNSIVKQYQKLFELEDIHLEFTINALEAIVKKAQKRKTGARALRSIIEESMIDIMFETPSKNNINSCIITKDVINKKTKPTYKLINKKSA